MRFQSPLVYFRKKYKGVGYNMDFYVTDSKLGYKPNQGLYTTTKTTMNKP